MTLALVLAGSLVAAGSAVSGPIEALGSVYMVTTSAGAQGTAFAVRDSTLVTAAHVVEGVDVVRLEGTQSPPLRRQAVVRFRDEGNDVAILDLAEPLPNSSPVLSWSKVEVVRGLEVFAVGSPIDGVVLSRGEVVQPNQDGWIIADSPVDPGNSGGPLLDESGAVLGVVVAQSEFSGEAYIVPATVAEQAVAASDELPVRPIDGDGSIESAGPSVIALAALVVALFALVLSVVAVTFSVVQRRRLKHPPLNITLD